MTMNPLKQSPAELGMSLDVECPHCDHTIDLLEDTQANANKRLLKLVGKSLGLVDHIKDCNEPVTCPACSGGFVVPFITC